MQIRDLDIRKDIDLYVKGDIDAFTNSFPGVKLPAEIISEITASIKAIPNNEYVHGITACEEFEPIGFVIAALQMFYIIPYVYIESIYVEPKYRGAGISQKLLEKAEHWGIERGAKFLQLHVSEANESAINSYKKSGYVSTRTQMEKII